VLQVGRATLDAPAPGFGTRRMGLWHLAVCLRDLYSLVLWYARAAEG
jgi:hypothetical protein